MSSDTTFAGKLSTLRAERKMGVRELGRAVGVTGMHISDLEKGKSAPPGRSAAAMVSTGFFLAFMRLGSDG